MWTSVSVDTVVSVTTPGPALDAARARVVADGLTVAAIAQLNPAVSGLSLEALGPVKQLLKRFFSELPWTEENDDALASAMGPEGSGVGRHELAPGLTLVWGWELGRFRLRVETTGGEAPVSDDPH
jgi:hypothetical protein